MDGVKETSSALDGLSMEGGPGFYEKREIVQSSLLGRIMQMPSAKWNV